jgi:F-type H+-transporting ATPase subunit b
VFNEETVVAFCLLTVFYAVFKYGGPAYTSWSESEHAKMNGVLNAARQNHTDSVKDRITSVQELGGVVDITKALFEVSKVRFMPCL